MDWVLNRANDAYILAANAALKAKLKIKSESSMMEEANQQFVLSYSDCHTPDISQEEHLKCTRDRLLAHYGNKCIAKKKEVDERINNNGYEAESNNYTRLKEIADLSCQHDQQKFNMAAANIIGGRKDVKPYMLNKDIDIEGWPKAVKESQFFQNRFVYDPALGKYIGMYAQQNNNNCDCSETREQAQNYYAGQCCQEQEYQNEYAGQYAGQYAAQHGNYAGQCCQEQEYD